MMAATSAVYRSGTPSLSVPQTRNTAPVLEFSCLYTHDIRRKQKRWQDGFLRYHTFNRRVMVYDVPRNFIGDTHWKEDGALQDGDEVTLEKDGVIVQVAENVGTTLTDLTELKKSKKKAPNEQGSSSPVRPLQTPYGSANGAVSRSATQLKHRSLNALLGTPKGPIGKAQLPSKSPFETRHMDAENQDWDDARPPKRQRIEQPSGCNDVRTTRPKDSPARKETPLWARTADSAKHKKKTPLQANQARLETREIIDPSEDVDEGNKFLPGFSSDALAPSSSPKAQRQVGLQGNETNAPVRSSSPAFQTQMLQTSKDEPSVTMQVGARNQPVPIPRRGTTARIQNDSSMTETLQSSRRPNPTVNGTVQQLHKAVVSNEVELSDGRRPPIGESGRTLRMPTSLPKKKTLLCQEQLAKKPSRVHSENTEHAIDALLNVASQKDEHAQAGRKSQRKQLQERLAKIAKKKGDYVEPGFDVQADDNSQTRVTPPGVAYNHADKLVPEVRPQTPLEKQALELAQLDQMIMPPEISRSPEMEVPAQEERQLRRVLSESNKPSYKPKRAPGAPVRFTPSPAKKSPSALSSFGQAEQAGSPLRPTTALPPRSRPKRHMQRAVSLNTMSNGTSTVILSKPFQAPKPPIPKAAAPEQVANPWSREAFDLFTWRPPEWDEEKWVLKD